MCIDEIVLGEAGMIYLCTSDCDDEFLALEMKFLLESAPFDAKKVYEILMVRVLIILESLVVAPYECLIMAVSAYSLIGDDKYRLL